MDVRRGRTGARPRPARAGAARSRACPGRATGSPGPGRGTQPAVDPGRGTFRRRRRPPATTSAGNRADGAADGAPGQTERQLATLQQQLEAHDQKVDEAARLAEAAETSRDDLAGSVAFAGVLAAPPEATGGYLPGEV